MTPALYRLLSCMAPPASGSASGRPTDATTHDVVARLPTGNNAHSIAIDPASGQAFMPISVCHRSGRLCDLRRQWLQRCGRRGVCDSIVWAATGVPADDR